MPPSPDVVVTVFQPMDIVLSRRPIPDSSCPGDRVCRAGERWGFDGRRSDRSIEGSLPMVARSVNPSSHEFFDGPHRGGEVLGPE